MQIKTAHWLYRLGRYIGLLLNGDSNGNPVACHHHDHALHHHKNQPITADVSNIKRQ
jgi:hypothetical protein